MSKGKNKQIIESRSQMANNYQIRASNQTALAILNCKINFVSVFNQNIPVQLKANPKRLKCRP